MQVYRFAAHLQQLAVEQLVAVQPGHVGVGLQVFLGHARKHAEHADLRIEAGGRLFGLLKQLGQVCLDLVEYIATVGKHVTVELHVEARQFGGEQRVAAASITWVLTRLGLPS